MLDYQTTLKGRLAETAVQLLLQQAGYSVTPCGIESICPDIVALSPAEYSARQLSPTLRTLPDLLIAPPDGAAMLVEIKYRRIFNREALQRLEERLREQQHNHPDTHTILIRGASPMGDSASVDDMIRVLPPRRLDLLAGANVFYYMSPDAEKGAMGTPNSVADPRLEPVWRALRPIASTFTRLQGSRELLTPLVALARALATF